MFNWSSPKTKVREGFFFSAHQKHREVTEENVGTVESQEPFCQSRLELGLCPGRAGSGLPPSGEGESSQRQGAHTTRWSPCFRPLPHFVISRRVRPQERESKFPAPLTRIQNPLAPTTALTSLCPSPTPMGLLKAQRHKTTTKSP